MSVYENVLCYFYIMVFSSFLCLHVLRSRVKIRNSIIRLLTRQFNDFLEKIYEWKGEIWIDECPTIVKRLVVSDTLYETQRYYIWESIRVRLN